MKKILILIVSMMLLVFGLTAAYTETLTTVASKTVNGFAVYSSTTTYASGAVSDSSATAGRDLYSKTFSIGTLMSGKEIMITGVVNTSITEIATGAAAVPKLVAVLEISADNSNWFSYRVYDIYAGASTAGTVITFPVSLVGIYAPYYRIRWQGYNTPVTQAMGAGVKGAITTYITVPPN